MSNTDPVSNLTEDIKKAMKAGQKERLDSLRYLHSKLKNAQIDKGKDSVLTQQEMESVVQKLVKNSEEAIEQFAQGNRQDLVDSETAKVEIWKEYLPKQLTDEEIAQIVAEVKTANPDLQIGPLIGMVMKKVQGQADGGRVSKAVQANLKS